MQFIRQGATHKVVIGPAVAVGDGFTPVTTLSLSTADEAEAILHDNGTVVDISGYTFAAITTADGYYHLTLQSGISNTVGHLTIVINDDSLMLPIRADFTVVDTAPYDLLLADGASALVTLAAVTHTGATIPTVTTLTGHTAQTADVAARVPNVLNTTALGNIGIDWANVENPTTAVDLAGTDIQLADTVTTNTDMRGTDNAALASVVGALTDAAAAGDPTSADTLMQYVKQLINTLEGTAGVPVMPASAAPANNVSMIEMLRAVYDDSNELQADWADAGRLDAILDSRMAEASIATTGGAVDNVTTVATTTTNTDMRGTDNALTASVTGTADSGTTTTMVDAARTEADTDYWKDSWIRFTSGTLNGVTRLITGFTPATDTITFAPATTVAVATHTYDIIPAANIDLVNTVTTLTGHTAQTGDSFARIGATGSGLTSLAQASVATEARLSELDAANLPADIDAILSDTNELQTDDVPGLIAALNDVSAADVLTQVNAALDTAIAELGVATPTATPTLRTGLMLLYMALRNKTVVQTSGVDALEIYNDAGVKIASKALTDDGADYTEDEMV